MIDTESRKLAAKALVDVVAAHSTQIKTHPGSLRNLMNDHVPHLGHERFILCAALELPRFFAVIRSGVLTPRDFEDLQVGLTINLGLESATATWCTQSWQRAYGVELPATIETLFNCPNCVYPGQAELYWANCRALCPMCNSHILFSSTLTPSVHRQGWKKKRSAGGKWSLIGTQSKQNELKNQIHTILSNDEMSPELIADALSLDEICLYLRPQIVKLIQHYDCRPVEVHDFHLIKATVMAILGNPIQVTRDELVNNATRCGIAPEMCLAFASGVTPTHAIIFGGLQLGYVNQDICWALPYKALSGLKIADGPTVFDLQLSNIYSISVKGIGITRRNLSKALVAVATLKSNVDQLFSLGKR